MDFTVNSTILGGATALDFTVLTTRPNDATSHAAESNATTEVNEVGAAVEPLVPDEEAEENYACTIAYNDRIVTCVARLSQQAGAQRANAITAAEASRAPRNGHLRASGSKVKLPKLELQRFSGAATEWQPFWEQYR
ncbi:hypothetical protein MTO96_050839 [Rhipicephalus appendiculatus]